MMKKQEPKSRERERKKEDEGEGTKMKERHNRMIVRPLILSFVSDVQCVVWESLVDENKNEKETS